MSKRVLLAVLVLGVLAAALWAFRQAPWLEPLARHLPGTGLGDHPMRKCVQGGQVLYTSDACPQGAREVPLTQGSVSVLPAPAKVHSPAPAAAASATPLLRRLAGPGVGGDVTERIIDKATQP